MPVVGDADEHGVNVLAGEDVAIVDARLDPVAEDFPGMDPPALVQVGGGDQLDARDLQGGLGVDEADDAHADRGDPDAVVRAGRTGRLDRRFELVDVVGEGRAGDGGDRRGHGHGLEERSTRVAVRGFHGVLRRSWVEPVGRERRCGRSRPVLSCLSQSLRGREG